MSSRAGFTTPSQRAGVGVRSTRLTTCVEDPSRLRRPEAASLSGHAVADRRGDLTDLDGDGLADRLKGTKWINTNNVTFEWTNDGRLLHRGNERQWKPSGDDRVEVVFGKEHVDVIVFDESLKSFKQLIKGGPSSFQGRRVDK